jgi:transposase-like protein
MTMTLADSAAMVVADDENVAKRSGPRAGRPKRRKFTPDYKLDVLARYELLTEPGARGALLRKEGLYSSQITEWKRLRDAGALDALAAKPSGPKPARTDAQRRAEKLEAENARLATELADARKANEILGKLSEFLSLLSRNSEGETRQTP